MAAPGTVVVKILGDASQLQKSLDGAGTSVEGASSKFGALGKVVAGAMAGGAILAFGKSAVSAFEESAQAQSKLELALKNSSATIGVHAGEFAKLNTQLAKHTLADDDVIAATEAQMVTFGASKSQIEEMIPTVLDFAAKMGVSAPEAADLFDKASMGSVKALKALGIEGYKPTGDKANDLANIQAILASRVKGAAQAQLDAAGPGAKIKKSMDELQESVGKLLVPALEKAAGILSTLIDWFTNLSDPVKIAIGVVGGLAVAVWAINTAQVAWTAITGALTVAQAALNVVLDANPIGLIILAIAGLIAGLVLAYQHCEAFRDIVKGAFDVVKDAVTGVKDWISDRFGEIVGFFTGLPGKIASAASGMWDGIKDAFKGVINTLIGWWNGLDFSLPKVHIPGTPFDVGGFTLGTPDIPTLAGGGTINGLALVGERGPELFAGAGTIIPNHALGGITVSVSVENHLAPGIDMGIAGRIIGEKVEAGVRSALDTLGRQVTNKAWRN